VLPADLMPAPESVCGGARGLRGARPVGRSRPGRYAVGFRGAVSGAGAGVQADGLGLAYRASMQRAGGSARAVPTLPRGWMRMSWGT
jgi:hypothetical protein